MTRFLFAEPSENEPEDPEAHDFPGSQTYVFHCHNLEHEDAGMMINFRVQA